MHSKKEDMKEEAKEAIYKEDRKEEWQNRAPRPMHEGYASLLLGSIISFFVVVIVKQRFRCFYIFLFLGIYGCCHSLACNVFPQARSDLCVHESHSGSKWSRYQQRAIQSIPVATKLRPPPTAKSQTW